MEGKDERGGKNKKRTKDSRNELRKTRRHGETKSKKGENQPEFRSFKYEKVWGECWQDVP